MHIINISNSTPRTALDVIYDALLTTHMPTPSVSACVSFQTYNKLASTADARLTVVEVDNGFKSLAVLLEGGRKVRLSAAQWISDHHAAIHQTLQIAF